MSGKARPSLRAKTIENVKRCNLSQTDKDCIIEIFKRYEMKVDIVLCKECTEWDKNECECSHWYGFRENDYCSYGVRKDGAE